MLLRPPLPELWIRRCCTQDESTYVRRPQEVGRHLAVTLVSIKVDKRPGVVRQQMPNRVMGCAVGSVDTENAAGGEYE